ncbi:MAG: hemolysin family protein [Oscillospiraceae bacterium]|nr:hemolysin family protein [Oscillospiraceae bacterium]
MDDGSLLSLIIVLLVLSAYFAAAESAYASANKIKLKTRYEKGDRRAGKALFILDNFDIAISAMLTGTNIVTMSAAALVTVIITRRFGLPFAALGTVITTVVVFFVCEILPKSVAKKYSEQFALGCAASLCFFMRIFKPVTQILTALGSAAAKLTPGDAEVTVTEEELYDIIETMKDEGDLGADRGDLVHSALMFADVTAESVLTARVDVKALDVSDDHEEILNFIKEQKHSRLPVYRDSIDNIIGILQIRKYIKAYLRPGGGVDLEELLDEAYFVHRSIKINELLSEMSRKKLNLAVVTDNYGGTLGIVTVEDILEELVGEIWDEDDEVVEKFSVCEDGSFEIDAGVDMEDAFDMMDYDDPEDTDFEHKLIGEWAYEHFDLMPKEGDRFMYNDLAVTVSKMIQHRIMKLNIRAALPSDEPEGGEQ